MNKKNVIAVFALLLFPLCVLASPSNSTSYPSSSRQISQDQEILRQEILRRHTSWQWSLGVTFRGEATRNYGAPVEDGILVGMQAQSPEGPIRSIGWFTTSGKLHWVGMEFQDDKGVHTWKFKESRPNEKEKWENDPRGEMLHSHLKKSLGMEVNLDTLHGWAVGAPDHGAHSMSFIQDDIGSHPRDALVPQGKIIWSNWSKVESDKGISLVLPGSWQLVSKSRAVEFQVGSIEAYEADEIPTKGWPFVAQKAAWVLVDDNPVAKDGDLDYQGW